MNGSWYLGKLAGIDVRVHWTFLLLPVWIYFSTLSAGSSVAAATTAVIFVLAIFGCVVLHELGHALAARRFGVGTRDITLLPIGGVARLERMPRNPMQELVIALAGPAVNVVIAVAIFGGLAVAAVPMNPGAGGFTSFLSQLALVNIALVVFNMIPAFPMDGGRVLRSVLAMLMPYSQATNVAVAVGQVAAVGLGLLGLFSGNFMLILVAGFVFMAARGEAFAVNRGVTAVSSRRESANTVAGSPSHNVWHAPFERRVSNRDTQPFYSDDDDEIGSHSESLQFVSADWEASTAQRWLAEQSDLEFPVIKEDKVIGTIRKADLERAIQSGRGNWRVEQLLDVRFVRSGLHSA